MNDVGDMITKVAQFNQDQSLRQLRLQRQESVKTGIFSKEIERLEVSRSRENVLRKEMDAVMSDVMTILKKSGEKMRQQ